MKLFHIGLLLFISFFYINSAEDSGGKSFEIPFRIINNKVILPLKVNNSRDLRVILDSGMPFKGLILYHTRLIDSLELTRGKEIQLSGGGSGKPSTAFFQDSSRFSLEEINFDNQKILILNNGIFEGFANDGIVGYSIFAPYSVELDYERKVMILRDSTYSPPEKDWQVKKMEFRDNKKIPWIECEISIKGKEYLTLNCYIDLASSENIELLLHKDQKFEKPDSLEKSYIGRGLNGDIYGFRGNIKKVRLAGKEFDDVYVSFAESEARSKQNQADGIIGNRFLQNYRVIFNYSRGELYLK